jgi:hypothetical protein
MGLLNKHGEAFTGHLASIRSSVGAVADNTAAALARNQFARKSVEVAPEEVGQLRNDSAYGWQLKWVATSATGVRIYVGTENEESFMAALDPTTGPTDGHERIEWYLPTGGVVFIKNEDNEDVTYVNFEVVVLVTDAIEGHTGHSGEAIETRRREPIPSGSPLPDVP